MKKPYIILSGGDGGFGNLGDEFILETSKKFYKRYQKHFNIIILRHVIGDSMPKDGFTYIYDYEDNLKELDIPISDIALVHFYGGGFLNQYWYKDKIWLYKFLVKKGLHPSKFIFTGQGLGPFSSDQKRELQDI